MLIPTEKAFQSTIRKDLDQYFLGWDLTMSALGTCETGGEVDVEGIWYENDTESLAYQIFAFNKSI